MQSKNKVSYFLDRAFPRALLQIEIALASAGLEADLSYFKSQFLDVLPRGINKVSAVELLLSLTRVAKHRTVICGSSIGDLGLYLQDYRGIVTESADADLRDRIQRRHIAAIGDLPPDYSKELNTGFHKIRANPVLPSPGSFRRPNPSVARDVQKTA